MRSSLGRLFGVALLLSILSPSFAQDRTFSGNVTIGGWTRHRNYIDLDGISAPSVSGSGKARLYFDVGSGKLYISKSGGSFAEVATGGGSGTVTSIVAGTGLTGGTITSTGTIALSSPVALSNGGTAATTKAGGFDALSPMSASGDIIYGGASGTGTRLAKGSDTQVLTLASGLPTWATPSTGFANPLTTTGDLIYSSSGTTAARLGIGSSTQVLTVTGGVPVWATPSAGFSNPMTTHGDVMYESSAPAAVRLGGNTSTTPKYLNSTGTGSAANDPAWLQIAAGDLSAGGTFPAENGSALTSITGANVTGNISGNAGGLSSTLGVASGGTGATSFTTSSIIGSDSSSSTGALRPLAVGSGLTLTGSTLTASGGAGGGGSLILLEQHTASSSAELDFTSFISGTYDAYMFTFTSVLPATNGVTFQMQAGTGGGPTYDTTAVYDWSHLYSYPTASNVEGSSSVSAITFRGGVENTKTGVNGTAYLLNPASASLWKILTYQVSTFVSSVSTIVSDSGGGMYKSTTAMTAVRFLMSSGDIASGTIRCYGIAH